MSFQLSLEGWQRPIKKTCKNVNCNKTVSLTKAIGTVIDDYFKYFSYQYFLKDLQFYYITAYKRIIKSYKLRYLLIKEIVRNYALN